MKNTFRNTLAIIQKNFKTLILFELLYKVSLLFLAIPIFKTLLYQSMKDVHLQYLNTQNIFQLLKSPFAIFLLLLLIIFLGFYVFIEVTAVIVYTKESIDNNTFNTWTLFTKTLKKALLILKPKNIPMILFVIIMLPLAGVILKPTLMNSFHIPEYIMNFMIEKPYLYILYFLLILFLGWFLLKRIFSFPSIIIDDVSFLKGCRKSKELTNQKLFRTFFAFAGWFIIIVLLYYWIYSLITLFFIVTVKLIWGNVNVFWDCYQAIKIFSNFLYPIVIFVGSFTFLTVLYYHYQEIPIELKEENKRLTLREKGRDTLKFIGLFILIFLYILFTSTPFTYNMEYAHKVKVIAHRASASMAPENTLAALKQAIKSGSEYAEIDVQQTLDGELIIIHDNNLKRTTGVNQDVTDTMFREIMTYDAGSWFSNQFIGEKIPTLEEFLIVSKNKINLIIEIKPNNNDNDLVEKVILLVKKYGMEKQVLISSIDYDILEKSKKIDPNLRTNYIVALAFGDYNNLTCADTFSVESTFITNNLVKEIHNQGKLIFAWTVNKDNNIKKMPTLQVDGIITDNPNKVKEILARGDEKNKLVKKVTDLIFKNEYLKNISLFQTN